MTRKKNVFFTFCCSLVPGAGEMYMGFMKRGVSIMGIFFLGIFLSSWLYLEELLFVLPIIWFFSFFDTHNLRAMDEEEFYGLEDQYINIPGFDYGKVVLQSKFRYILAIILILIGLSMLWSNLMDLLYYVIPDYYYNAIRNITNYVPHTLIGIAIIVVGIYLIRGKKKELEQIEQSPDRIEEGENR